MIYKITIYNNESDFVSVNYYDTKDISLEDLKQWFYHEMAFIALEGDSQIDLVQFRENYDQSYSAVIQYEDYHVKGKLELVGKEINFSKPDMTNVKTAIAPGTSLCMGDFSSEEEFFNALHLAAMGVSKADEDEDDAEE